MNLTIFYVVVINYTTGCESESTGTELLAVFSSNDLAKQFIVDVRNKVPWNKYYDGTLEIEEIPFNCNVVELLTFNRNWLNYW